MEEDRKNKNLELWLSKLDGLGINIKNIPQDFLDKIKNATFTMSNENGWAFDGSFLEVLLRTLTPFAIGLNALLPEKQRVSQDKLIKVCLLHQISKAVRFVPNPNTWEVEKRKLNYTYASNSPSIRFGFHSLLLAQDLGITFSVEEAEAMTINDRDATDEQARFHSSVLATIVRQASELTYLKLNN